MKYYGAKPPSQRQLRVGEQVRALIADIIIRELWHPSIEASTSFITLTEVRISPDLKNASIFVVPIGEHSLEEAVLCLNQAAPFFKKHIGLRLSLRYVPKLKFLPDTSVAYAEKIETLLKSEKVQKDLKSDDS